MLPRLALMIAVLVSACSGGGPGAPPTTRATPTTSAPATTIATVGTDTTAPTTPPTTTTSITATTTTVAVVVAPDTAPTRALDSFAWVFSTEVGTADADLLAVESVGVYVEGAFDCQITAGFGGFDFTTRLVLAGERAWFDAGTGEGPVELDPTANEVVENLSLCAGSEGFWADITGGAELPAGGRSEERNGISSRKLDLTGVIDQAGALGFFTPGLQGVEFAELNFWVADPGDWINAIEMSASLTPEALAEITGSTAGGEGAIRVSLDITQPNDASLAVSTP